MKKIFAFTSALMLLFFVAGCEKKEPQTVKNTRVKQGPIIETPNLATEHTTQQRVEMQIVVPPEVQGKWSSVVLEVKDRKSNKTTDFTVDLGGELKIPDSKLTVKVGDFLPDFKLGAQIITSASNDPVNPAVGVKIFEDGKQIFPQSGKWGWLYVNHPNIHPFQHERFRVLLKKGIPK
jgi:predicted small lipoprotein YifL